MHHVCQGLAPGGVYEAQFGDHDYNILWRERLGFARAALKANVPVLPVFTENIRESFRVLPCGGNFFYWLFMKTRLPLRPVFGGFPVKLRTHIGEPIYPEEDMTPEMLRDKCKVKGDNKQIVKEVTMQYAVHLSYHYIPGIYGKDYSPSPKTTRQHLERSPG